jgi:hypothetical protein
VRGAVRPHHAINAKLGIIGVIIEVATVAPGLDGAAIRRRDGADQALVDPIPDEAALWRWCGGMDGAFL